MTETVLTRDELHELIRSALMASGVAPENALPVATALTSAEVDGHKGHGLTRVPAYTAQVRAGKVDGNARPSLRRHRPGFIEVDAQFGFAYPALDLAIRELPALAKANGIAAAAVTHSHHFGVAGQHCERLADAGLMAFAFGNAPKAIAPHGGRAALYGTNPIAFAIPRSARPPVVIDLALSVAARGLVMAAAQKGEPIPEGWALDVHGRPTTNAAEAMAGTMVPAGGAKGAALALMIELMAGAFIGGHFAYEASSLFDDKGPPPNLAQFLIAVDVGVINGADYVGARVDAMAAEIEAQGARLPGSRRLANRERALRLGLSLPTDLVDKVRALASEPILPA
jgi:(2R)-3-sulfolactate dehydrogenase (NADP+)